MYSTSLNQTCKRLHALALSKALWIVLISDLRSQQVVDLARKERLEALSSAQLIDLAKRAVEGPISWSSSFDACPVILHRQTLQLNVAAEEPSLLLGGRYLLCQTPVTVMCWELEEKKLVWTYNDKKNDRMTVDCYAACHLEEESAVVIVVSLHLRGAGWPIKYVFDFDLRWQSR